MWQGGGGLSTGLNTEGAPGNVEGAGEGVVARAHDQLLLAVRHARERAQPPAREARVDRREDAALHQQQ